MGLSNNLSREAGSFSCCCPNPHGCFHSEVWGFISSRWSPGLLGLLRSLPFVLVYLCVNVGPQGLLVVRLPAPFVPHSTSLGPRQHESSPPRLPVAPLLLVWMNVSFLSTWRRTFLPFDFLSVLVVQGGAVCLPMPPSWFSPGLFDFFNVVSPSNYLCPIYLFIYLFIIFRREGKEGRKRVRETSMWERNINWLLPIHTPTGDQTCNSPGIEPMTFCFVGQCLTSWATLASAVSNFWSPHLLQVPLPLVKKKCLSLKSVLTYFTYNI